MAINFQFKAYSATLKFPRYLKRLRFDSVVRHLLVNVNRTLERGIPMVKGLSKSTNGNKVIVSLTSFPARIDNVDLVVRSLMNQSRQPDKIVLWLSKDQFANINGLPKRLLKLQNNGLDIRVVEGDIKSHKKYFYAFREFCNDYVMLADDDILYPHDTIASLLKDMTPTKVHCSYGSIITYGKDDRPLPYCKWQPIYSLCDDAEFFFGSGGGTLMMPSSFIDDIYNISKAMELTPKADDIWLNAMARLSGLTIKKVRSGLIFPVTNSKEETLASMNIGEGLNDIQLSAVMKEYTSIFRKSK